MEEYAYRDGCRMDYFAYIYCEIAMEEFYKATMLYKFLSEHNFSGELINEENELNKHILKTIVFSAMTIESFLNNFIAVCIGDKEFRNNFDKLSSISKLQLIVKFIFKSKYDKSRAYHANMHRLFQVRNNYVHNKSSSLNISNDEWDEVVSETISKVVSDFFEKFPNINVDLEDYSLDRDEITKDYNDAVIALNAIKEIAILFDEHDNNIHAIKHLFSPEKIVTGNEKEKEYRVMVFSELNIKVEDCYEE